MESRLLLLLLLTVLARILPLLSANSEKYTRCGQMFRCGTIGNISYPFWGGSRLDYCGHSDPSFHLDNCQGDEPPIMTINSFPYRVLAIDNQTSTLTLVRDDYWKTVCPDQPHNVKLDDAHFRPAPGTTDLMLYYDCQITGSSTGPPNQFSCPGRAQPCFYARDGAQLNDGVTCRTGVRVQVTTVGNTMPFDVARAVSAGFGLVWDASNIDCDRCAQRGGQCGSDPASGSFACFEKGSSVNRIRIALPIVCGFVALVGIGLAVFGLRRQRKRVVTVRSSQSESKDDPPSSMSKGLMFTTTPSADLSQSTPSYESSTSNFGNSSSYFGVQVFSYSELEEATDNFNPSRELGEGGFGTVYYGKLRDNRAVAVKRLYENNFKRIEQFMNELDILTRLRHENLVTLYGCTSRRSRELLLVYEYISNGTVADHLHGNRPEPQPLSWPTRLKIAIETAGALAYLHKSDVIHRDVKTNNILLDNDFRVKVADFGLSRLFPTDVTHVSTAPQGTPGYVDPEYHQCYQLTEKSDVYSFGVVLIELISSKQAVDTSRERLDINLANMAINRIQNQALNELVDPSLGFETDTSVRRMTTSVAELAFRCLQTERDMRPSMADVLKALRGIKDGKLSLQQAEVLEIVVEDDVALLRGKSTPVSPRSPNPVDV